MTASKIQQFGNGTLVKLPKDDKIILVGGCFDILHFGHLYFLQKAKALGGVVVVALESDEFITTYKKRKPTHNQNQRAAILSHLDLVDMIILLPFFHSHEEYNHMVELIKPDIIAVTKGDTQLENKKKQALTVGGKVAEIEVLKQFSSSNIIRYETISSY